MLNRERIFQVQDLTEANPRGRTSIPILGSEFCFPEDLLKTLAAEFDRVDFMRTDNLSTISKLRDERGNPRLMLIDAQRVTTRDEVLAAAEAAGTDMLVLAYGGRVPDRDLLLKGLNQAEPPRLGLLPLNVRIDVLLAMMRLLLCGEILVPEAVLKVLLENGQHVPLDAPDESAELVGSDLTRREWEVLSLLAEGKQNKIVAAELGLSEHTVKLHIHHLIHKLGVSNRTGAAIWYLARGEAADIPPDKS